ncbi:MAG: 7-carboxy-7-deazaguanine synthase QueE [Bacteroidales bacterium]
MIKSNLTEKNNGLVLPIVEEFYSLQGEGYNTGIAAYFIRLAGCDVRCSWCDSKESWKIANHPMVHIEDILKNILDQEANTVVITGGEPTIHNLEPLTTLLRSYKIKVLMETSGTHPISGTIDWIAVSPKKHKKPLNEVLAVANELKVIIETKDDFKWAEENAAKAIANRKKLLIHQTTKNTNTSTKLNFPILFLQPEWNNRDFILPIMIDYVKRHPQWRISLQTHKFMNIL